MSDEQNQPAPAEGRKDETNHPADALEALLEGAEPVDGPAVEGEDVAQGIHAEAGEGEDLETMELDHAAVTAAQAATRPLSLQERKARDAAFQKHGAHERAMLMKRILLWPLAVVGGLLIVLGITMICKTLFGRWETSFSKGAIITAAVLAFPLGGVLLGGAWTFYKELYRKK